MKYIKLFEEITNISKSRTWPLRKSAKSNWSFADLYFVYQLPKSEIGKYLNVWFVGANHSDKTGILSDEMITLKECDRDTTNHLYHKKYNPVSLRIMRSASGKYNMKFQIHSVDDSSYGIWWNELEYAHAIEIRNRVMETISYATTINGESLLEFCEELGADPESKDYN